MKRIYPYKVIIVSYILAIFIMPFLIYYRYTIGGEFNVFGYVQSVVLVFTIFTAFLLVTKSHQYLEMNEVCIQLKSFKKKVKVINYLDITDIYIKTGSFDYLVIKSENLEIKTIMNIDILNHIQNTISDDNIKEKIINIRKE